MQALLFRVVFFLPGLQARDTEADFFYNGRKSASNETVCNKLVPCACAFTQIILSVGFAGDVSGSFTIHYTELSVPDEFWVAPRWTRHFV